MSITPSVLLLAGDAIRRIIRESRWVRVQRQEGSILIDEDALTEFSGSELAAAQSIAKFVCEKVGLLVWENLSLDVGATRMLVLVRPSPEGRGGKCYVTRWPIL